MHRIYGLSDRENQMSPLIHLITAWLIALAFSLELKERRIAVFNGIISDIDGVFILFSHELYIKYHHGFGHNLIFGMILAIILSLVFSRNFKVIFVSLITFSSHLLLDFFGTSWAVNPIWPIIDINLSINPTISNEYIYRVIDPVFAMMVFIIMAWIIFKKQRSPVEFISLKLDKIFSGFFVYPFKYRCRLCDKRAPYYCEDCKDYFCARHVNKYFATKCKDCDLPDK
jgi:hypothetical protein